MIFLNITSIIALDSGIEKLPNFSKTKPELPLIVIVTTGGTIAEKDQPQGGGAVPAVSGKDLIEAVPELAELANIAVYELFNIDSSQMTPQNWRKLSSVVNIILEDEDIDGVVVTHGTDTIALGAYFLDLTTDSEKPVVFTGAMNNASSSFPDGPGNLYNAVKQAISEMSKGWGVTVTLNTFINSARDVRKIHTTNMNSFGSGEKGLLGYVSDAGVIRINNRLDRMFLELPAELPKVIYLSTYPGDDGMLLRFAVDNGADGIVIDGLGAGNVNASVYQAVKYALSKKIPVVISTGVYYGDVLPIYGGDGGGKTLQDDGCILSGNLRGQKARLLLMLGLAQYGYDRERITSLFSK